MLQNLREHAQGWIAGIICALLALAFALWGVQYYLQGRDHKQTIAKVNGFTITDQAVNVAYERLKRQNMIRLNQRITLTSAEQVKLKRQALSELINRYVLSENAKKNGYYISEEALNSAITELPAFQVNGKFAQNQFQQVLSIMMYSPNEFYEDLRNTLLISQVQTGLTNSAFILPNEVYSAERLINQRRDFKYKVISHDKYINSVQPSAQQIKKFYQTNKSKFKVPAQVKIAYIKLSASEIKKRLPITEQQLKTYYENNISDYSTPKQWRTRDILIKVADNSNKIEVAKARIKINSIYSKLKAGANFDVLAKKYSEDAATAKNGGKSDWFTAKQGSPVFIQIVTQLRPGEISSPFQNSQGFNIVKLLGEKPEKSSSFNEVRSEVKKAYEQQAFQQALNDNSDKLSELTYTNPSSLEPAARALDLPIQTTNWFSKKGSHEGITKNSKIVEAAFSDDVFMQGNNSDLIQLGKNTIVVLRIKNKKPASIKPLNIVFPQITRLLRERQASEAAKNAGLSILQRLKTGGIINDWRVVTNASRQQIGVDPEILEAVFDRSLISGKTSFFGVNLKNGDYAVIALTKVTLGNFHKRQKQQKKVLENELAVNFGQLDYALYVQSVMKNAKIKIYNSIKSRV